MRSNFTSWSDALLLWCNNNSIVGFKLIYFIAIIVMAISTPLLYILWKKPGYYRKVFDEITANEKAPATLGHKIFNIAFTVIFVCCFCVCIVSWVCFMVYTLLFIGL